MQGSADVLWIDLDAPCTVRCAAAVRPQQKACVATVCSLFQATRKSLSHHYTPGRTQDTHAAGRCGDPRSKDCLASPTWFRLIASTASFLVFSASSSSAFLTANSALASLSSTCSCCATLCSIKPHNAFWMGSFSVKIEHHRELMEVRIGWGCFNIVS